MATAQQIWDDVQAKKAALEQANAAVDSDKTKLATDTAAAQQAAVDESGAEAVMTSKFPEGQSFVFGNVSVAKLHGEIVVLPVTDPSTDLG